MRPALYTTIKGISPPIKHFHDPLKKRKNPMSLPEDFSIDITVSIR